MNIKTLRKAVLILALALGFALPSLAQTALTQTTLSSAVSGPALYSGTSATIDQNVFLASVSGISAPTLPGTPVSIIYVGREAMGVFAVNASVKSVGVFRGYLGTQAAPHPSGDMVLISNVYSTTSQYGANPVPSGFFQQDPPIGGACTAANTPTTPWVNILTGAQWLCSTITGTWVPGFQNPWAIDSASQTATVPAAAGTVLPTGPLFVISGAGAITGFTVPVGCNATAVGGCSFTVIAAAGSTWTWTAAGNIMTAGTGTAGHTFTFTWSASLSKFVPSSLS
jgi:hypothetical protein